MFCDVGVWCAILQRLHETPSEPVAACLVDPSQSDFLKSLSSQRGQHRREGAIRWKSCMFIVPVFLQQLIYASLLNLEKKKVMTDPCNTLNLCLSYICECVGGESTRLLISDVIESQWESVVVLYSIQAPPPACVHGSPHGPAASHFHHALLCCRERERGREAEIQSCCSWLCALMLIYHVRSERACKHMQATTFSVYIND